MSVFFFPQYECVFIHNPKTGGTSIRHGLLDGQYEGPVQGRIPDEWKKYFKFCFVRNPYDRLISAWKMFTTGMQNSKWKFPDDARTDLSLQSFLAIVTDDRISYDGQRRSLAEKIRHHTLPQSHPFNCVAQADFVGRFETIEKDFAEVCRRIGIEGEMPHWNKTLRASTYHEYFDDVTRQVAAEFYAEDLRIFGYEFELPDAQQQAA